MGHRVLILLLALSSVICTAHPNTHFCESLLTDKPVPWTIQPVYLVELESSGFIVPMDRQIPRLRTGFYVYLVLSTGEILISPKYDVKQFIASGKGLATHKSLLRMYSNRRHRNASNKVVLGGEFQNAFGAVADISNRCGNFRSRARRFHDKGLDYLQLRGLPLQDWTSRRAINPKCQEDRGHTPEDRNFDEFKLNLMADVEKNPRGPVLRALYEKFFALIVETFPAQTGKEALVKMLEFRSQGALLTRDNRGAQSFYYPLLTAFSRDGMDFGLASLFRKDLPSEFKQSKPDNYFAVPTQIHNVIVGAGDMFDEATKEKWRAMAHEFESE